LRTIKCSHFGKRLFGRGNLLLLVIACLWMAVVPPALAQPAATQLTEHSEVRDPVAHSPDNAAPTIAPIAAPQVPVPPVPSTSRPFTEPPVGGQKEGSLAWLQSQPTPIIVLLISSVVGALVALLGLFINPWNARKIAREQAEISKSSVAVAGKSAEASLESARAAAKNAEAAVQNASNQGIHSVARLRQSWIDTVRVEISELISIMVNYREPAETESEEQRKAREERQRQANFKFNKVKLLLNPKELTTKHVVQLLSRMDAANVTPDQLRWLAKWIIRWMQILLKDEWERVKSELKGEPTPPRHRRLR
jgi:hypothetical protein